MKNILSEAGISMQIFSSRSCRSSDSSKAKDVNIDFDNIVKIGCWNQQQTFRYCEQIQNLQFAILFIAQQ